MNEAASVSTLLTTLTNMAKARYGKVTHLQIFQSFENGRKRINTEQSEWCRALSYRHFATILVAYAAQYSRLERAWTGRWHGLYRDS